MASLVTAQTSTPRRTVWDGVYTEAQAARGQTAFGQSCAGCHALTAARQGAARGRTILEEFRAENRRRSARVRQHQHAERRPGSLNESTYRDIVAVMLKSNGFPAGTSELERNTISGVQIIPKDGGTELPANALARVIGCLARSGADWVVTNATTPERAERLASARGRRHETSRWAHDTAQVRRDQAGSVRRCARRGEWAADRNRRCRRHERNDGEPCRRQVPLSWPVPSSTSAAGDRFRLYSLRPCRLPAMRG